MSSLLFAKQSLQVFFWSRDLDQALAFISPRTLITKIRIRVSRESLTEFILGKLTHYYKEELDAPLVLFDMALDHILRELTGYLNKVRAICCLLVFQEVGNQL